MMKYIHILFFLYFSLTNMFASEDGALIQSNSGRDCPPGYFQDCSDLCWLEANYNPNGGTCENGEGNVENSSYPNFSCLDWGFDGAYCSLGWEGTLGSNLYSCNGEISGGDCADCNGIPNGDGIEDMCFY